MTTTLELENIKCGGCANTLMMALHSYKELKDASVDPAGGLVRFTHPDDFRLTGLKRKLHNLGYPVKGTVKGLEKAAVAAVSYASCVIGKLSS